MVPILSLWAPIALSTVLVFFLSSILHMVLSYHRSDYRPLPNEQEVADVMRRGHLTPGTYMYPHCADSKSMATPEMQAKFKEGPVFWMSVIPSGLPVMGKFLTQWVLFVLGASIFVAYLTGAVLAPGAPYLTVFRVAGTAAFLLYGYGCIVNSIWKGQPWSTTFKEVADGLAYALVTAGCFGWLWPAA